MKGDMYMKTIQGKEFDYSDIVLYKLSGNQQKLIVFVDDKEQLEKLKESNDIKDTPVAFLINTSDEEKNIITKMKQINSVDVVNGALQVKYEDGSEILFDLDNENVISDVQKAQLDAKKVTNEALIPSKPAESQDQPTPVVQPVVTEPEVKSDEPKNEENTNLDNSWANISAEEKEATKKKLSSSQKRQMAGILAAIASAGVAGGVLIGSLSNKNSSDPVLTPTPSSISTPLPTPTPIVIAGENDYTAKAEQLVAETEAKDSFIITYQQAVGVKWDTELAKSVIEYANGLYPYAMSKMNAADAQNYLMQIEQAINLIIAGSLNSETAENNMINLADYISSKEEQALVNDSLMMARATVNASIGEPMNGKIIGENEWTGHANFSQNYLTSVDNLLNYEYDVIYNSKYAEMYSAAQFIISSNFQNINYIIPTWKYVENSAVKDGEVGNRIYYRYFSNDNNGDLYMPREASNGRSEYVLIRDEKETGDVYDEDTMFAMAGQSLNPDYELHNVKQIPGIKQYGIEQIMNNAVDESMNSMREDIVEVSTRKVK